MPRKKRDEPVTPKRRGRPPRAQLEPAAAQLVNERPPLVSRTESGKTRNAVRQAKVAAADAAGEE